ncbi:nitrogenase component 1 [uncultured Phascolarctobacterium sp.]|uniref:nitrogenase component 1 n=1 Tax=uncultured Phascolarctobacterium sp. TaxID=512296 RepID=UPI0025FF2A88|nr:nitrogenase component 1 [uncultured Phascolarctobacterium sp.]
MGIKEDAMWKMAEKMGMPKSAIEAIKAKQKQGGKTAMPDMGKMMSMMKAMKGDKQDEMRKMAEKMGMPPQAVGMDGNELLDRLNRLSRVQTIKDVPQLTTALFPGTHCPLMGAAMIAGGIDDCLLVIVGTDECSYYTKNLTINERYGGIGGRCVSVVLDSHDVTFGSTESMHKAFAEIVEEYQPKCVMLVTTCVIEVIGDDYDAIAEELTRKYQLPVMAVHTEHFKCEDHFPGFERALTACQRIMQPQEGDGSVNVLGQRMGNFADTELHRLLAEAGVKIGVQLPSGCTTEEIRRAPAAKVNIVVHDIALPLAQAMQEQYGIPYVYFNRFAAPEKVLQAYQHLFNYLELPLPAEVDAMLAACKEQEKQLRPLVQGVPYIYGNTQYDCFELNSYLCSLGLVPQLIQSNHLREDNFADIQSILEHADPYICKAANIAPLQYVYDVLHPWFYMGHEFGDRLRAKGIALLHSDPAGKMLGFECSSFLLQAVAKAVSAAKRFREEAGL